MKSQVITLALVALVAGLTGGLLGSTLTGGDGPAAAAPAPTAPAEATPAARPAPPPPPPPLRSVEDELKLIEARGNWDLRMVVSRLRPMTIQVGSETLISYPKVSWKPGEKLTMQCMFYRYADGELKVVDVAQED